MKKLIIVILLLTLTGCGAHFGGDLVKSNIDIEKELIKIEQEQEKDKTGKYKRIEKYEKEGMKFSVPVEYVTPNGEIGYMVEYETAEFIEYIGYGVEAESRTFKVIKNIEIATST